ncbi:hypothetical protein AK812_SmicGene45891 [Symbiodinium microadriaticum]|uniref:USP domain-containing protein n=1 Tax=Symbiodinium microadriaticum TaxID=2951 RepID=A0A1Q9BUZ9_SYMMI|nr:hypothetical protein AK812_SmicGene45891 [Symbiodinium microadriaticum]
MLQTPSSKSTAVSLGLLLENEGDLPAMKWDSENRKHVPDTSLPSMKATEAVQTLQMILQRCTTPLVISRYHATRKLAQEYQGDTLTMLLEVGLLTKEANEVWSALHRMEKSSAWVAAGTYLRFPSFDSELRVVNCQYILRSAIVHHGNTPDSGHYTALLFDRDGTVWHADDNTCSTLVPEGKISGYYSDIYILFYTMM